MKVDPGPIGRPSASRAYIKEAAQRVTRTVDCPALIARNVRATRPARLRGERLARFLGAACPTHPGRPGAGFITVQRFSLIALLTVAAEAVIPPNRFAALSCNVSETIPNAYGFPCAFNEVGTPVAHRASASMQTEEVRR